MINFVLTDLDVVGPLLNEGLRCDKIYKWQKIKFRSLFDVLLKPDFEVQKTNLWRLYYKTFYSRNLRICVAS
jgi:hypothetical protein